LGRKEEGSNSAHSNDSDFLIPQNLISDYGLGIESLPRSARGMAAAAAG